MLASVENIEQQYFFYDISLIILLIVNVHDSSVLFYKESE
jgi:hypothetical protein